ncbi:hypothetical protein D3C77_395270 [compost metagenome]
MIRNIFIAASQLHYFIISKFVEWNGDRPLLRVHLSADIFPYSGMRQAEYSDRSPGCIHYVRIEGNRQLTALRRLQSAGRIDRHEAYWLMAV